MAKILKRGALAVFGALFFACLLLIAACGGPTAVQLKFMDGDVQYAEVEAEAGADITGKLPEDPEKAGYVFGGWYADAACTGEKEELPTVMPAKSATYYAKWTEAPKAALTLDAGEAGTLENAAYEAYEGQDLFALLEGVEPATAEGVYFEGWYRGAKKIESGDTMPAEALTLTAHYSTDYTVNIYEESAEGTYAETPDKTETGRAPLGEAFEPTLELPAHFEVDYAVGKPETDSLAVKDVFEVYLRRERIGVTFEAAAPEDAEYAGSLDISFVPYGGTLTLPDGNAFGLPANYRFGGWATAEDEYVGLAGTTVADISAPTTYRAVWETGVTDIFGGGDYLFVATGEQNTVYLRRDGLDDIKGSYDALTGAFSFEEGEETALSGYLAATYYYYYKDAVENTYGEYGNNFSTHKLTILPEGRANYVNEETGEEGTAGSYVIGEDGVYTFTSDDGAITVVFKLMKDNAGSFTARGAEYGYYAMQTADGYDYYVLYLDGFGGAVEHYDPEDDYFSYFGQNYLAGKYTYSSYYGYYTATFTDSYGDAWDKFNFKFPESGDFETPQEFGGFTLRGVYQRGDDYEGTYGDDSWTSSYYRDLELDGFGAGEYQDKAGTYVIYSEDWYTSFFGIPFPSGISYVVFTDVDGEQTKFLIKQDYDIWGDEYGYPYYLVLDGEVGRRDFEGVVVLDGALYECGPDTSTGIFLYALGTEAQLYIGTRYEYEDGTPVYLYTEEDEGTLALVGEGADAKYCFSGEYFTFNVRFAGGKATYIGDDLVFFENETGKLYIDNEAKAYYAPKNGQPTQVEYEQVEGILANYRFTIDGVERSFVAMNVEDEEGNLVFKAVELDRYYDPAFVTPARQLSYSVRVAILGKPDEEGKYLALLGLLAVGEGKQYYLYYATATVKPVEGTTDEFDVELSATPSAYESYYADYTGFRIKTATEDGAPVYYYYDGAIEMAADKATLKLDGYGNAQYTDAAGTSKTGTYAYVEGVLVFSADGEDTFFALQDAEEGSKTFAAYTPSKESGYYYDLTDSGAYYFFMGNGNFVYFDGSKTYTYGTYEFIREVVLAGGEAPVNEYKLTVPAEKDDKAEAEGDGDAEEEAPKGEESYIVVEVASNIEELFGLVVGFYAPRMDDQMVDVALTGGGSITGDGYTFAIYETADGVQYSGLISRGTMDPSYTGRTMKEDPEGKTILYTVLDEMGDSVAQFVFDLLEGDETWTMRTGSFGEYALMDGGVLYGDEILLLDGHGGATILSEDEVVATGTIAAAEALDGAFIFKSDDYESFVFHPYIVSDSYGNYYVYCVYTAEADGVYTTAEDWSVFLLTGYGMGTYIDHYGVVTEGYYSHIVNDLYKFESADEKVIMYFNVQGDKFTLNTSDFIYSDGVLYVYRGTASYTSAENPLKLPDEVTAIADGVFSGVKSVINYIDFNNVTEIGNDAFNGYSYLKEIVSDKIGKIGKRAFVGNTYNLTKIELTAIKEIGESAFEGDTGIKTVILGPEANVGPRAFSRNEYNTSSTLTVDLTGVTDLTKLKLDATAFQAVNTYTGPTGALIANLTFYVANLNALNAVYASTDPGWQMVKPAAALQSETEIANVFYYSFTSHLLYAFEGGKIIAYDKDVKGTLQALYVAKASGITLYALENNVWAEGETLTSDATSTTFGTDVALRTTNSSSTAPVHTFKDDADNDWTIKFTVSKSAYSISLSLSDVKMGDTGATAYSFDDSKAPTMINVNLENGNVYELTFSAGTQLTAKFLGQKYILTSSDDKYRVTVTSDGNEDTIIMLEIKDSYWKTINDYTTKKNEDGSITVETNETYPTRFRSFQISYDLEKAPSVLNVTFISDVKAETANSSIYGYFMFYLKYDVNGKLIDCEKFLHSKTYAYDEEDFSACEILKTELNEENGWLDVTVKDGAENNEEIVYRILVLSGYITISRASSK